MSKNEKNQESIDKNIDGSEEIIDNDTGEVKEVVSRVPKFDRWNPKPRKGLDYSRKLERQFVEVAPYAKDEKGKFINEKSVPVLIETDPIDVDAQIQSYKDDVDIYKILEKWMLSGDNSLINPNGHKAWEDMPKNQVYDYTEYPDNIHDLADSFDGAADMLNGVDNNIINDIVNTEKDSKDIASSIHPIEESKNQVTTNEVKQGGEK